jgi:two-component system, LytTR family, sensor kinase
MPNIHEPLLVNTIGHSAGAVVFGIFLFLLLRDRAGGRLRERWQSFTAAALAFLWNAGSLAVLATASTTGVATSILVAFSFSVLSFLPAVLLHISLGDSLRPVIAVGYLLSLTATFLHFSELSGPSLKPHEIALLLITVGFGVLTAIALAGLALQRTPEKPGKTSRMLGAMCSSLFAMSFVHFGSGHPTQAWSKEIVFHHAGIPLALFVLLQDYRFVLLDAFIRFLANVFLAGLITFIGIRAAAGLLKPQAVDPVSEALLLTGSCLLLIVFALLRSRIQAWLTRAVFRRPEMETWLQKLRTGIGSRSETQYLDWAAGQIGAFMEAEPARLVAGEAIAPAGTAGPLFPAPAGDLPQLRGSPELAWVEAVVPLRLTPMDVRYVLVGRRRGGRRYLSEDLEALNRLATVIVEEVNRARSSELNRLVSQAELRALQSQINPHFLFNALNTLYGVIPREAAGARRTVLNLAEVFRYFLRPERTFIPLAEELQIINAYLDIERLRLGPRLETHIDVDEAAMAVLIPVLSIQPLVENAIKHGVSAKAGGGKLTLMAKIVEDEVRITVADTGPGMRTPSYQDAGSGAGLGLGNVTRRLQLCYGPQADLRVSSGESGTSVQFSVPVARSASAA